MSRHGHSSLSDRRPLGSAEEISSEEFRSPCRDVVVDDNSPRNQISRMRMLGLERAYTSADAEVARGFAIT